jgi:hypothetical protein
MICPSSGTGDRTVALEPVDAAVMARTALFSPELDRLFVTVPQLLRIADDAVGLCGTRNTARVR